MKSSRPPRIDGRSLPDDFPTPFAQRVCRPFVLGECPNGDDCHQGLHRVNLRNDRPKHQQTLNLKGTEPFSAHHVDLHCLVCSRTIVNREDIIQVSEATGECIVRAKHVEQEAVWSGALSYNSADVLEEEKDDLDTRLFCVCSNWIGGVALPPRERARFRQEGGAEPGYSVEYLLHFNGNLFHYGVPCLHQLLYENAPPLGGKEKEAQGVENVKIWKSTSEDSSFVLVTGGAGFIGSVVVRVVAKQSPVLVYDNLSTGLLSRCDDSVEFVFGDVRDLEAVKQLFQHYRISHVIHLAALSYISESVDDPDLYFAVNVGGTRNVVQCAKEHGVQCVVLASSTCVYGNQSNSLETTAPIPLNPYAVTKLAAERVLASSGLRGCSIRLCNVIGAGDSPASNRILAQCVRCCVGRIDTLVIYGNGEAVRDYIHVEDAAMAALLALENCSGLVGTGPFSVFNIGCAHHRLSVQQIIHACQQVVGERIWSERIHFKDARPEEAHHCTSNYAKAREILSFEPKWTDFLTIVRSMVDSDSPVLNANCGQYPIVRSYELGDTLPSPRDTIGARLVLLVRHGTRIGGTSALPPIDEPLSWVGREEASQVGKRVAESRMVVHRVVYSPAPRCQETARLLAECLDGVPEMIQSQFLGNDGPFVANREINRETLVNALARGGEMKCLTDIVDGCEQVPAGNISRDLGVSRLLTDLKLFSTPGSLLIGVSHDMIIAAVKRYLGFPQGPWPNPACGVLFDLNGFDVECPRRAFTGDAFNANESAIPVEWVEPTLKYGLSPKNSTLAIYGIPTPPGGQVINHDHCLALFHQGSVVCTLEMERISRVKHDGNVGLQLDSIVNQMVQMLPDGVGIDVTVVNSMSDCMVKSFNNEFQAGVETGVWLKPTSASLAGLHQATCTKDDRPHSCVAVSHEIAHVFSGMAFQASQSVNDEHLLIHLDGAASVGNFSAWHWKEGRICLLECGWELSSLSKIFNDNGLMFAIIGASKGDHLSAPGKLMGLSAYGTATPEILSFLLENNMFSNCWDKESRIDFWRKASAQFNWNPHRSPDGSVVFDTKDPFLQNVVAAMQQHFTDRAIGKIKSLQALTGCSSLILSGGCALNIHMTARIEKSCLFESVFIPPCCSDTGLAIGAAAYVEYCKHKRHVSIPHGSPYLINMNELPNQKGSPTMPVVQAVAKSIAAGKIVGICVGAGECGPRALGNRSILALPTMDLKYNLSEEKKKREWYRPVAPVMLLHNARRVIEDGNNVAIHPTAQYMLTQFTIRPEYRQQMAGVVHADGSSRIQIVKNREQSPFLFDLLTVLEKDYDQNALINTSFNRRGEPIVQTSEEAICSARSMQLDALLIGNTFLSHVPPKLRVLFVIHGYPPRYNAGSEVYTQSLAHALHRTGHEVAVCARTEDQFQPDYSLSEEADIQVPAIRVFLINMARSQYRFQHDVFDRRFAEVMNRFKPDVVHVGHLSHLSLGLIHEVKKQAIPIVFTLHDFWLACPRGQFLHWSLTEGDPYLPCSGYDPKKCAATCFNRIHTGVGNDASFQKSLESWFSVRQSAVNEVVRMVDKFIAPSRQLLNRMVSELPAMKNKTVYRDYGFPLSRLPPRPPSFRAHADKVVFGFIGRHHPSKGIDMLIRAFGMLSKTSNALLRIWGRPQGQMTAGLTRLVHKMKCSNCVEWLPEYRNDDIYQDVFLQCDIIVVPSIWDENSPLVLHEALQARVPIITAAHGGMQEFVQDGLNGFTFEFRSVQSLSNTLLKAIEERESLVGVLARRGYLDDEAGGRVVSIDDQARDFSLLYYRLLKLGPRRCTFDYQTDVCNLHCVMCEQFSGHNTTKTPCRRAKVDIDSLRSVFAQAAVLGMEEAIPPTMGEPLLTRLFDSFLEWCSHWGVRVNLTTNGTFPRHGAKEWAKRIIPIASDVKISWNGATKETQEAIMCGSQWEKRLEDLRAFVCYRNSHENGATITLQLTFMERNLTEIPNIIRLALKLGIDRVKGHHLWVFYDETKDQDLRRSRDSRTRWNDIVKECRRLVAGTCLKLENFFPLPVSGIDTPDIEDLSCPFLGREAWVNPQGIFSPCCAPDKDRKSLGDFGSILLQSSSLQDIWSGEKYADLCQNYLEHDLCKSCLLRRPLDDSEKTTPSRMPPRRLVVAKDRTHHVDETGAMLYAHRFKQVLSFHDPPGLAPVQLNGSDDVWTCVDRCGNIATAFGRYRECWGFYEDLCAVKMIEDGRMRHVDSSGMPLSPSTSWNWVGNFQGGYCVVSDDQNRYHYIDHHGKTVAGPYKYAGDFVNGVAAVSMMEGGVCLVDKSFAPLWKPRHDCHFLLPPHKGLCVAKGTGGFFHVESISGAGPINTGGWEYLEPFYNGRAVCIRDSEVQVITQDPGIISTNALEAKNRSSYEEYLDAVLAHDSQWFPQSTNVEALQAEEAEET